MNPNRRRPDFEWFLRAAVLLLALPLFVSCSDRGDRAPTAPTSATVAPRSADAAIAAAIALQDAASATLLDQAGVVGTGVGFERGQPVLVVLLERPDVVVPDQVGTLR